MAVDPPLITKARDWLVEQGFSLEMRVSSAFRRAGFIARQAAHYVDRNEGKSREIDVMAMHPESTRSIAVQFAVECKASPASKPWLVLLSEGTLSGVDASLSNGVVAHDLRYALEDHAAAAAVAAYRTLAWQTAPALYGYALRKAFTDRDEGHAAAAQACKAAQYSVLPLQADRRDLPAFALCFPVIVVDTPICECRVTDSGDIEAIEVGRSEFLFQEYGPIYDTLARVRLVHIDHLLDFCAEAFAVATAHLRCLVEVAAHREANPSVVIPRSSA